MNWWRSRCRAVVSSLALGAIVLSACGGSSGSAFVAARQRPLAWKLVHAAGVQVQVPSDWAVYMLAADASRCVRVDVHAVYVGRQSASASCPARALGRTESVQISPIDTSAGATSAAPPAVTHVLVQELPAANAVVTVTFGNDQPLAQQIMSTVKVGP
jgi:hypothetical protein